MLSTLLDIGANRGDISAWWLDHAADFGFAPRAIAIEATPQLLPALATRLEPRGAMVVHEAAWTHAQGVELFLSDQAMDPQRVGATLCEGKTTNRVNYARGVRVPSVDVAMLLTELACELEGQLVLKLDIEGAEYSVLERLLARGALDLVAGLIVETHHHKVLSITAPRHEALMHALRAWAGEPIAQHTTWLGFVHPQVPRTADDRGLVGLLRAMLAADTRCAPACASTHP
jgi:FkbM family methyltransferase